jgi:hypothetical protein
MKGKKNLVGYSTQNKLGKYTAYTCTADKKETAEPRLATLVSDADRM